MVKEFFRAIEEGNTAKVKRLISEGVSIHSKIESAFTPLHVAAEYCRYDIARFLIENGADVNARTVKGWRGGRTPLHFAARGNCVKVAQLLISKGVDVNVEDDDRFIPLHYAAFYGSKEMVVFLISKGANVNAKTDYQKTLFWTPLYFAIEEEHFDIVKILLKNGADLFVKDKRGKTPFDYIVEKKGNDFAKSLLNVSVKQKPLNVDF